MMGLLEFCLNGIKIMCMAGVAVASWPLTQEVARFNLFSVMTNIFNG